MFGKNPIRKPVKGDGEKLDIQHIFLTIQGEGPFAGIPAVFIRLGGCNLACTFCDTEFESFSEMALDAIVARTRQIAGAAKLVVITGGEPLRQPIERLCASLILSGFRIQVETNGTLYRDLPEGVSIVCSPKNTSGNYAPIRDDLLARLDAIKFIVSADIPGYMAVADVGQNRYGTSVFIQPMDEQDEAKNKRNLDYAKDLAIKEGYRLSLQLHKIMDIE